MQRAQRIVNHLLPRGAGLEEKKQVVAVPTAGSSDASDQNHGGKLAASALVEQGVKWVFTLTGGHIAPILVGANQAGIKVVDVRDEATTVFAADAVSRLTGVPGVAVVTAGPGLTNTITAVKNAQMAQSPVVVFAGATAIILKGRGSLQDIDQFALMKPHVKKMWSIRQVRDIIPTIRDAFRVAQEGVPGPVFVEFPIETLWPPSLFQQTVGIGSKEAPKLEFNKKALLAYAQRLYLQRHINTVFKDAFKAPPPALSTTVVPHSPLSSQVAQVAKALSMSERPVILIGSQALRAGSTDALKTAIEALGVPVYLSGMGRGLLGKAHPLQMRHKRGQALAKADFVLLAGVPADFRLDYGRHIGPRAYFATANLDRVTLTKNNDIRPPDVRVYGDPLTFLRRLSEIGGLGTSNASRRKEWKALLDANEAKREREIDDMLKKDSKRESEDDSKNFISPIRLCKELDAAMAEDAVIVADGGDFVGTASYIVRPRGPLSWLDPGVFGTLGVGGGFALGAKLVRPQSETWVLYGDGSSGYSIVEFDTYVRFGLPVIAVIGNDACWSQMYRDQIRLLKDPVATELSFTSYDKVAEGYGAKGIIVRRDSEIKGALQRAKELARKGHPVLVNCLIAKSGFREGSISL